MSLRNTFALSAVLGLFIATPSQAAVYNFTLNADPATGTYSTGGENPQLTSLTCQRLIRSL